MREYHRHHDSRELRCLAADCNDNPTTRNRGAGDAQVSKTASGLKVQIRSSGSLDKRLQRYASGSIRSLAKGEVGVQTGAIVRARWGSWCLGRTTKKTGMSGSLGDLVRHPRLNHQVEGKSGVDAEACGGLMRQFFCGHAAQVDVNRQR